MWIKKRTKVYLEVLAVWCLLSLSKVMCSSDRLNNRFRRDTPQNEILSPTTSKPINAITSTPLTTSTTTKSLVKGRARACNVLVGIDEPLYEEFDQNMTNLIAMAQDHFNFVNNIFAEQVFTDDNGFGDVYFNVARVQVFFGTCDALHDRNCTTQR